MGWEPRPRWDARRRRFHVTLRGHRYILGRDHDEAYRRFAVLLREIRVSGASAPPLSVVRMIELWKLDHPGSDTIRRLTEWTTQETRTALTELADDSLERLARTLRAKGNGPGTVRVKVMAARRVCRWGVERHYLDAVPRTPRLAPARSRPRDLLPDRLAAFLASLQAPESRRFRAIVQFMLATGCRPGEARLLRWSDIGDGVAVIPPERSKTRDVRTLYLNEAAAAALDEAKAWKRDAAAPVFITLQGGPYTQGGLSSNFRRRGITAYSLRHTFAHLALESLDLPTVQRLLGHTNIKTTEVYVRQREHRIKSAAQSLTVPRIL